MTSPYPISGTLQDQYDLIEALERHDSAEKLAGWLMTREGVENANRAYNQLCAAAMRCGFSFQDDMRCLDWSRRRVAIFKHMIGRD